jgi:hypothetical protein
LAAIVIAMARCVRGLGALIDIFARFSDGLARLMRGRFHIENGPTPPMSPGQ